MRAQFLKSAFRAEDIPKSSKPQIAVVGRSNVGKSSLINHLIGGKSLARTSSSPGLTQSINIYECDGRYLLIDLPGYGYSGAERSDGRGFASIIGEYLSNSESLKQVLLIVDGRLGLTESDCHAVNQLSNQDVPFVVIFNKTDKLSKSAAASALRKLQTEFPLIKFIPHSTVTRVGIGEIRNAIDQAVRAG